ncbi:Circadian clock protein kinase KaiC [Candidatus Defluviicoccus seviourii]|uniref:non-specific serine/threonine protein kinase n=1 Tax=Candidatus Defluviicoccus seviourii TaxID=2565273 RepID=A0A564WIE9_9PROT|nr:Circadian clock protein kinase KaiC [Candidatus Defluviicoccus seviourii]
MSRNVEHLLHLEPQEKVPTGVEGFELVTMGGLPKGRPTLLCGSSGSGKTLLSMEVAYRSAAVYDRTALLFTMEEPATEIVRNIKRMGWDTDPLVRSGKLIIIDLSPVPVPVQEAGSYDLEGLIAQVRHIVQDSGAETVVIDSVGSLFQQFADASTVRRELFRLIHVLRELQVTSIITAERLSEYGPISRYGVEEFVSDNIIVLRNVLRAEKVRRTIQVVKMRGDAHHTGEFPFTISRGGISILPLSARELTQPSSSKRVSIGNDRLDEMLGGGLFRDALAIVSGPTGAGKTLLAGIFAADGCSKGERVLMLAYEESRAQLLRNAQSWGMDFEKWESWDLLRVVCQYPEAMGLEDHLLMIQREIEAFKPTRLVIDSLSALERIGAVRYFREFVIGLTSYARQNELCTLFTSATPRLSGGDSITEAHISTITDAIILLRYVEIGADLRRGISVIKMRGSQHAKSIHEFAIDNRGMRIGEPFANVHNIILGMPRPGATPAFEGKQLAEVIEDWHDEHEWFEKAHKGGGDD